jgi:hypothetical protein
MITKAQHAFLQDLKEKLRKASKEVKALQSCLEFPRIVADIEPLQLAVIGREKEMKEAMALLAETETIKKEDKPVKEETNQQAKKK